MELSKDPQQDPTSSSPAAKPSFQDRLKHLVEAYGPVALGVWAVLAVLVFGGAALALHLGLNIGGTKGTAGTFVGAYAVYQLTKPLRLAGVVALTPLVARLLGRSPRARPQP